MSIKELKSDQIEEDALETIDEIPISEQSTVAYDSGMSVEKAEDLKGTGRRLFQYLMRQKKKLFIVITAAVFSCVFTMTGPLVVGKAINLIYDGIKASVTTGVDFEINFGTMGAIALILLTLYLLTSLCSYLEQQLMAGVSQTLTLTLRKELSFKMTKLPLRYFDQHQRGEVMSRVTNDLERVSDVLQQGMMQFITSIINIVGAIIIMLVISPVLTAIALVTIVIGVVITILVSSKSHAIFAENQKCMGQVNGLIEEFFTGRLVVKAFNREPEAAAKVEAANERLYKANARAQFMSYAVIPAIRLFNQMGYVLIAVIGAVFVIQGRLSLGIIQAFFQYMGQVAEPITEASYTINMMQAAVASAERVFKVLDEEEEEPDSQEAKDVSSPKGDVGFEHVHFGYSDDKILMNDININVQAGQKIAIVGPTGAGKTTLINLLMRFYELQGGRITIDGTDIKEMRRGDLRGMLGMVLQDAWIFGGTVKENISYSCETASEEEILQAAKAAHVDHFVRTLPEGYNTVLNDEGTNISQGQRQLLTIARAILADPPILILDEATSSVDTRTEMEIQKAMDHLMKGRTSFVIAHRLSTILDADRILVMKEGTIVEQGSHRELMEQNGAYADLYNSQFAS